MAAKVGGVGTNPGEEKDRRVIKNDQSVISLNILLVCLELTRTYNRVTLSR